MWNTMVFKFSQIWKASDYTELNDTLNLEHDMDTPVITGYYRYTDIWFDWYEPFFGLITSNSTPSTLPRHLALPVEDDRKPLKAVLAHDALVHPDNPLRKPGVNGIELHHG
jgi:hypothetical protein